MIKRQILIASIISLIIFATGFGGWFLLGDKSKEAAVQNKTGLTDDQLKDEIGQMIMIGFRGTEALENYEISKIIKNAKIGGVVLFDFDVPSNSYPRNIVNPEQTKKLISDIQAYSQTPLFVAIDAEGGNINRLKQKYGFLPIVSAEKMGQDKTLETVRTESEKLTDELKNAGFNMNLSPVIDLNINPQNPIIGALGRSFSSNPYEVFSNADIFITNHLENNIITVEKHFPGQGSASTDNHVGTVDVTNTYNQDELTPYKELNDNGLLDAVMVGHIVDKNVDENYPATMSSAFIDGLLRKRIGFSGVVISDDMQMAAITKDHDFADAIIKFINASGDIVSVLNNSPNGYDAEIPHKVENIIFNAVKNGKISEKIITESYNRIISLKKKFRIITPTAEEISSEQFKLLGSSFILNFGEALNIANNVSRNTSIRPAFLLAISQEELNLEKSDMCYLTNLKTGEGIRPSDGKKMARVMNPERDIPDFLLITKELDKDPLKTFVTCPMSFGWGGAMGPLDFIPSTWMRYKNQLEKITGKPADPWSIQDAFLTAGIYLSDSGAKSKTSQGEWNAAMIYFSGSINSPYTWYADGVMTIANKVQADIDIIEKNSE